MLATRPRERNLGVMPSTARSKRLSKSRFVTGLQCHKLLWWRVHEPDAPELEPDIVLRDRFDQGKEVGEIATTRFPGGTLIDHAHRDYDAKIASTVAALAESAPSIYEASFRADGVFVAVDVLERTEDGHNLIEVKSSTSQKPEHVWDAAIQAHVLRQNSIAVPRSEIMHLNTDFRTPDLGDLFARTDVTEAVERFLPQIPGEIERQLAMLAADDFPDVPIGRHCEEPFRCPFFDRCWPQHSLHIRNLNGIATIKAAQWMEQGVHWIPDFPVDELSTIQERQIRAMAENRLIVEPSLADDLEPFTGRLGFLDFETIIRAIPPWPGMKPWGQEAAQFSYHELQLDGSYSHADYLAEGAKDARPDLAAALLKATREADWVVMYSPFERTRIKSLKNDLPDLAEPLEELEHKMLDLHPVIKNNVYHPDFLGSFSIKYVLTPLVPELTYDDLVIVDGLHASVEIARLLFVADKIDPDERDRVRQDLLDYCERDTWAMVKLLERLFDLTSPSPRTGTRSD